MSQKTTLSHVVPCGLRVGNSGIDGVGALLYNLEYLVVFCDIMASEHYTKFAHLHLTLARLFVRF
jgi:hypothetical protein